MKISTKIMLIVAGILIIFTSINLFTTVSDIKKLGDREIKSYEEERIILAKRKLKALTESAYSSVESIRNQLLDSEKVEQEVKKELEIAVNIAYNFIETYYEAYKDIKNEDELKIEILNGIKGMKYGEAGYVWVHDVNNVMLAHPINPQLEGRDLSNLKDENNTYFIKEMTDGAKSSGTVFVSYLWPKPGFDTHQAKLSYAKLSERFDWIIGCGEYIEDIEADVKQNASEVIKALRYDEGTGYFWINDDSEPYPKMIMHPISPQLNGQTLDNEKYNVATGPTKNLFKAAVEVSKNNGDGYVEYLWPKPGKDEDQPKLSYVKYFREWNWVIGTGFYIDDIYDEIAIKRKNINTQIKTTIVRSTTTSFILLIFSWVVMQLFTFKIIVKPIKNVVSQMKIVSNGDLTERMDVKSKDELGILAAEFNGLLDKLNETLAKVKDLSKIVINDNKYLAKVMDNIVHGDEKLNDENMDESLAVGIKQLEEYIGSILDNVRNQVASGEQSFAALEEIAASSSTITTNIQSTLKSSAHAVDSAHDGFKQIEEMVKGMQNINNNVSNTQNQIDSLIKLSDNIGNIVTAINDLAEQTNLLALNAAIESARAGEAGKGFAVVADEVRKLAEKTNKETEKIDELIKDIQNEIKVVKTANTKVENNVHTSFELTSQEKETIQEIINITNKNSTEIEEVSTSIKEQSIATEEITKSIGDITESSTEIEEFSMQTHESSQKIVKLLIKSLESVKSLADLADNLEKDLDFFKTKK